MLNLNLISLEFFITAIFVGLVIADIFLPKVTRRDWIGIFSLVGLFATIIFWLTQHGVTGTAFGGMFMVDSLSWFFKGFFLVTMAFIFVMTQEFFKSMGSRKNEFYLLLWLALLGMCLIASSADFLVLFISLEILSISLYVMTAYLKSDARSLEAGMKYLILGALSAGFLLFGISFLYGMTGSTRFEVIQVFSSTHGMEPLTLLAVVMIFSAIGFKIAATPFNLWVPDVYQGAPTPVTALLSVGSKAAGFVMLLRLFFYIFPAWHPQWSLVLAVLSAVTMCYGNLGAMFQTNIKRLLGYSSIGHGGYLLMGAAAGSLGLPAINFYLTGYLFTNLAMFLVIVLFYTVAKSDELESYNGLAKRSGFLAAVLIIALASLAGIPPLAGFFGKFTLLMATVNSGLIWLALVAAVNIVISSFYYLKVIQRIFVDAPHSAPAIPVSLPMKFALGIALSGIIVIGIFQGPFLQAAINAFLQ